MLMQGLMSAIHW